MPFVRMSLALTSLVALMSAPVGMESFASSESEAPHHRGDHGHMHVALPKDYAAAHIPVRAWTDARTLERGKAIYTAKCAVCHGELGDGKGPGGAGLPVKPADLTEARMVAEMPGNYWFWRVSEGGQVQPFKSLGSAMPAWKNELSVNDRWAVIAYAHTLSGHRGPHTPREHPEMGSGHMGGGHGH